MTFKNSEESIFQENVSYPFDLNAECTEIHGLNASYQCLFAMTVEDCVEIIEYIDYNNYIFCSFGMTRVVPAVIIFIIWLSMLFITLGVTSNCFLCPALFAISKYLGLSQNVAGVTLLAFGNGSPDIFSSAAGLQKASAELAIASLVGAGAFVTTVVAGSVFLCQSFSLMIRPFLRDMGFYIVAICWTFALFHCGQHYVFHGIGFVILYFVYIVVVLGSRFIYVNNLKSKESAEKLGSEEKNEIKIKGEKYKFPDDPEATGVVLKAYYFAGFDWYEESEPFACSQIYSVENNGFTGSTNTFGTCTNEVASAEKLGSSTKLIEKKEELWNFLCAVCPINLQKWPKQNWWGKLAALVKSPAILILTITVPVIDTAAKDHRWCRYLNCAHCVTGPSFICLVSGYAFHLLGGAIPVVLVVASGGFVVAMVAFCTSVSGRPPAYHWVFAYLGFAVAVVWIYFLANEIVALLQVFGVVFNLSDAILGLTILAWGNSLSDFLSNVAVARKEYPRMGISACFGGPLLALLLGLGIPCIIEVAKGRSPAKHALTFSGQFAILFSTVTISILMTTIIMAGWKFETRRWYGGLLVALYVVFVTLSVLEESKVFQLLP